MKVLFTNIQLDHRTGTEIVTRDLALGMRRRGHEVAVYTPHPGAIADELIVNGIPVVDCIANVPFTPDVVHGHHHSPTVEALTRFPSAPAIWVCHDRFGYQDIPLVHPGINRYVAVDLSCRERLVGEAEVPEARVHLIHNSVSLERFQRRAKLPTAIARAAIFSNSAKPGGYMDVIAEACRDLEIPLDVIGQASQASSDAPEHILREYDIVFAKARCALEALATGCAVMLIDQLGMGPIVTTTNMALLRDWNFGARCLQGTPTSERIATELKSFDPADAAGVTDWIRNVANLEKCLDEYSRLYDEVLQEGPADRTTTVVPPIEVSLRYAAGLEQRLRNLQVPILALALPPTIAAEVQLRVAGQHRLVQPGTTFGVDVLVSNRSNETLASVAPYPVHLSYHWICPGDRSLDVVEGIRTGLSHPLHPGDSSMEHMSVEAPRDAASYVLRVSLVQEAVFWFDELTPPVACWLMVDVAENATADTTARPSMTVTGLVASVPQDLRCRLRIERDGVFADLGFVDDRTEQMLVFAGTERFVRRAVDNPTVTCIVTTAELVDLIPADWGVLVAEDPKETFFRLHNWIAEGTSFFADHRPTTVAESATVHGSATIDPVGVCIDEHCIIGPNVTIQGPVRLGPRTRVDAGSVIGASAFQTSTRTGRYVELCHAGGVEIGEDCHVYANAVIARGVFHAPTQIGDRCQIGNGAFVSHQCDLGDNVFVGHNATLNGRVSIGDEVWIGPGAIVSNDLTIGAGAHIALGSTVMQDVATNAQVSGMPALDKHAMFRHAAAIRAKRR